MSEYAPSKSAMTGRVPPESTPSGQASAGCAHSKPVASDQPFSRFSLDAAAAAPGAGFTAAEIRQQPDLWRRVEQTVSARRADLDAFLVPILGDPRARIVLTGAGSSAYAGKVLAGGLSRRLHRQVEVIATTDLVCSPQAHFPTDAPVLLVSFARSGDSPESVAAVQLANQLNSSARHLVITCNSRGHLATASDLGEHMVLLMPAESNDRSFAMTSSFTCMAVATLLAFGVLSSVEPLIAASRSVLASVDERVSAVLAQRPQRLIYLGSGAFKGLCDESALKCLELTAGRVIAVGESSMGFRHGPKALLNDQTCVICYLSNDPYTRQYDLDIVAEITVQLGVDKVFVIDGGDSTAVLPAAADQTRWTVPGVGELPDEAWALPALIHAQALAFGYSVALGITPDNPFPSGEVNRVVAGVVIHPLVTK